MSHVRRQPDAHQMRHGVAFGGRKPSDRCLPHTETMKQPEDQKTGDRLDSISQIERGIAAMSREAAGAGAMISAAAQPDVIDVVPGVVTTNAAAVAEAHDAVTALTDAQRADRAIQIAGLQ